VATAIDARRLVASGPWDLACITPPLHCQDMIERRDCPDNADPIAWNDPTENIDIIEPTDPIDMADPTDPIDSTDPLDPMDRTESDDHSDHSEPLSSMAAVSPLHEAIARWPSA
jgi:hypothetical protein